MNGDPNASPWTPSVQGEESSTDRDSSSPLSAVAGAGDRLRCGADIDELLEQVAEGRADRYTAHQLGCPYCQAALAEYDRLWAPVRRVAQTPVRAPDTVLDEALRRIRGAASDPEYGSLTGPTGTTRISARVVVTTARETAQEIAGVRVALSKLAAAGVTPAAGGDALEGARVDHDRGERPRDGDHLRVVAGVSGRSTVVEIVLAADFGTDLHALGERIRGEVAAKVRDFTGLEPVAVHVRIDDVFT